MALDLGTGAHHSQILRIERKALTGVECDRQRPPVLGEAQLGRPGSGIRGCGHLISQKGSSATIYTSIDKPRPTGSDPPQSRRLPRTDMNVAVPPLDLDRPAGHPAPLIDPFARAITYLRVSVTDRCAFRCVYCMSENMSFLPTADLLSLEELDRLCSAFIAKGVTKLRLTGGEPLVRRGIM